MSFPVRKNYFKDYFYQEQGDHALSVPLNPYCARTWWYDPLYNADYTAKWYISYLLWTQKDHGLRHHIFTGTGPLGTPTKNGVFCQTGADNVAQWIQYIETSNEDTATAGTRPGFLGQFGALPAVQFTGTMYEAAMGWGGPSQISGEPTPTPPAYGPVGPFGMALYADGGPAPVTSTDGIYVIAVPVNSTVSLLDSSGTLMAPIAGPALVVAVGTIYPFALEHVQTFTTYDNGDAIEVLPDQEYFVRLAYWPEQRNLKQFPAQDVYDSARLQNKRLKIWWGTNEYYLPNKYVGECSLIEFQYDVKKDYCYLFAFDYYLSAQDPDTYLPYQDGVIQFDQVVVGSEWLPYDEGQTHLGHTDDPSWAVLRYKKESDELTHNTADTDSLVPVWQAEDQVEVWAFCRQLQAMYDDIYLGRFADPFPDGWGVVNTTGAWTQFDSQASLRDEFIEVYSNKGRDPNWTLVSGAWDTSTYPGYLYTSTGAGSGAIITTPMGLTGDFVLDMEVSNMTVPNGSSFIIRMGVDAANATAAGTLQVNIEQTGGVERLQLIEYVPAGTSRDTYNTTVNGGTHQLKVIRVGAYCKVYWDGALVMNSPLATTGTANAYLGFSKGGTTGAKVSYVRSGMAFFGDYGYMTNTGVSSLVDGSISRSVASLQDAGQLRIHLWEAFEEGSGTTGSVIYRLYYDGVLGSNNWLGVEVAWDGATKTLLIYDANGSSTACQFPSNTVSHQIGYTEHKYILQWQVSGGNVTSLALYNGDDAEVLGYVSGLTRAYTSANPILEVVALTQNGTEPPVIGDAEMWETPADTDLFANMPLFHGVAKRPKWSQGWLVQEFKGMDYQLAYMDTADGSLAWEVEKNLSFMNLLRQVLLENGDPYWRWFHYWNFNSVLAMASWVPHRFRGTSWWDALVYLCQVAGLQFQVTPEQQFVVDQYYRDFYTIDVLGFGDGLPQGLHLHPSEISKSQLQYFEDLWRIDDAHPECRASTVFQQPVDFIQDRNPASGSMIGSANPGNPIAVNQVTDATRVTTGAGRAYPSQMQSAVGADNAAAANVASYLDDQGANILGSVAHLNQMCGVRLIGTKLWYRPMDQMEFRDAEWEATVNDGPTPNQLYRYVVQSADFLMGGRGEGKGNRVEYVLGRIEEVDDEEVPVVQVDGYGPVREMRGAQADRTQTIKGTRSDANL